jgi:hypothetical protein
MLEGKSMMKRIFLALMIAGILFAVVYAAAAALDVSAGFLQAGSDDELQCDTSGVVVEKWGYESVGVDYVVDYIVLGTFNPLCNGSTAVVRLFDDDDQLLDEVEFEVNTTFGPFGNGGSHMIDFPGDPPAEEVYTVSVLIAQGLEPTY